MEEERFLVLMKGEAQLVPTGLLTFTWSEIPLPGGSPCSQGQLSAGLTGKAQLLKKVQL